MGCGDVPPPASDGYCFRGRGLLRDPHCLRRLNRKSRSSTWKPDISFRKLWSFGNASTPVMESLWIISDPSKRWRSTSRNTVGRSTATVPISAVTTGRSCLSSRHLPDLPLVAGLAIRKNQTTDRNQAHVVQWDTKFNLVKVNPLLELTKKDVWAFIREARCPLQSSPRSGLPEHGCWPCTCRWPWGRRARGRWAGKVKKECGLHVIEHTDGSGI